MKTNADFLHTQEKERDFLLDVLGGSRFDAKSDRLLGGVAPYLGALIAPHHRRHALVAVAGLLLLLVGAGTIVALREPQLMTFAMLAGTVTGVVVIVGVLLQGQLEFHEDDA